MKKLPNYRLRVVEATYSTFVVRRRGRVDYISANETPLALSNLVHGEAAVTRFILEDSPDGQEAGRQLQEVLRRMWVSNLQHCPTVKVLP